jgi:SAM-dependent methyltransferase
VNYLAITETPGAFETWLALHFPGLLVGQYLDPNGDAENDGIKNLLEFAFGLNPNLRDPGTNFTAAMMPADAGGTDLVLTFRNVHNWSSQNADAAAFQAFFAALKPGGILGVVVMAAAILAGVMLWASGGVSFLGEQGARGLQVESVGALPFMVWNVFADVPTEFRFGAMEVDLPVTIPLGLAITLAGFAVLGVLGVLRLLGRLETIAPADVALVALLVSVVTSRVLSPQYDVWIVGVAAVTFLDPQSRMRVAVWLLVPMLIVTQVIYPFAYGSFLIGDWWAVLLQVARIGLLLAATATGLVIVGRQAVRRTVTPAPPPVSAAGSGA